MQHNENSKYPADTRGITCKKHYGVMGNPIAHSKSPIIHRFFAEQTQLSLEYKAILVPLDAFETAVKAFQEMEGCGLNITQPFKQHAYQLADHLSSRARQAKAVNTLRMEPDGTLFGDNTDGVGLIRDLKQNHQITLAGKRLLLLGAGGAARGILQPLLEENPSMLVIANRTKAKAQGLIDEFPTSVPVRAISFIDLGNEAFDLVINATSISQAQENDNPLILPPGILSPHASCYDLVYGHANTPFAHWAKIQKSIYINGLGMLIEQAAESFYLWHNVRPDTFAIQKKLCEATIR